MNGRKRIMLISLSFVIALALVAIGAWIYVVSNIEQPKYTVVVQDGAIELRDYPPLIVAQVTRNGARNEAVRAGFGALAAYIFAKNRSGESISMTAPVMQTGVEAAKTGQWLVQFVMPAKYTLDTLPKAADDDVRFISVSPVRRAAIRFSGVATDGLIATNETALREWLNNSSLRANGPAAYAYYNDPFTPGPLRRNEVLLDVLAN